MKRKASLLLERRAKLPLEIWTIILDYLENSDGQSVIQLSLCNRMLNQLCTNQIFQRPLHFINNESGFRLLADLLKQRQDLLLIIRQVSYCYRHHRVKLSRPESWRDLNDCINQIILGSANIESISVDLSRLIDQRLRRVPPPMMPCENVLKLKCTELIFINANQPPPSLFNFLQSVPNLKSLHLDNIRGVGDIELGRIAGLPDHEVNIKSLIGSFTIGQLTKSLELEEILHKLFQCTQPPPTGTILRKLETVELRNMIGITEKVLLFLMAGPGCPNLRKVRSVNCFNVILLEEELRDMWTFRQKFDVYRSNTELDFKIHSTGDSESTGGDDQDEEWEDVTDGSATDSDNP